MHQGRRADQPQQGFTLIELLVAIALMALMAAMSWRGLDGMTRAQTQMRQHADEVLTLQAGLAQWGADLDALAQQPNTPNLDWDGRALRLLRTSSASPSIAALLRRNTRQASRPGDSTCTAIGAAGVSGGVMEVLICHAAAGRSSGSSGRSAGWPR